jgi:hypothetical protein
MGATKVLPDCRDIFVKCLKKEKPAAHANNGGRLRVLLVDEVDVFFGDSFYGQAYRYVSYACMYVCIHVYMLVDEVDVCCGDSFYGQAYREVSYVCMYVCIHICICKCVYADE